LISVASDGGGDETYKVAVTVAADDPPPSGSIPGANATAAKIAYDSLGNLYLAFYDSSSKTLQFAERNTSGVWTSPITIDPTIGRAPNCRSPSPPTAIRGSLITIASMPILKYAFYNGSNWEVSTPTITKPPDLCRR